jgi:N2,N2-dimethylguanosine tRNA methyltransferase
MAKLLRCNTPPLDAVKSALLNGGYTISVSHCDPIGLKTNAPMSFLWDIMRKWVIHSFLEVNLLLLGFSISYKGKASRFTHHKLYYPQKHRKRNFFRGERKADYV